MRDFFPLPPLQNCVLVLNQSNLSALPENAPERNQCSWPAWGWETHLALGVGWMVSATVMSSRNSCGWYFIYSCFYKGVEMVISVASAGSWYCLDIFDVAEVDCCKLSKMIFDKTAVVVLVRQKAWQCFHGALPICLHGWSTLSLLPAVHSCALLPGSWHPETERLGLCLSLSGLFWVRGSHVGLHTTFIKQLTKDQIPIAGPCGRVTPEVLFSFPLLIYLSGKLRTTVKPLQCVLMWLNGCPVLCSWVPYVGK